MTTSDRKPFFRYHPNAYAAGGCFEPSEQLCDLCRRPAVWRYTGSLYAANPPKILCADCIANGNVALAIDDHFSFHDIDLHDAAPELEDELLHRTPGVACFNPFVWPTLDGSPLAFLYHGDDEGAGIWELPAVRQAIAQAFDELGEDNDGPSPYVLLFKTVDGEQYKAVIDLD